MGKSTLSWLTARALAAKRRPVALVDFDLTGTSLADALRLRAPTWVEIEPGERLPLNLAPTAPPVDPRDLIRARARESDPHARHVPFLNDFLLWEDDVGLSRADVHPDALAWHLPSDDPLEAWLRVFPSSALPEDLAQILALLYDEPFCAWVESRVEWLLNAFLAHSKIRDVVIDTPPTIPGLSRALLSAAMRLTEPGAKLPLADDGSTPPEMLWAATVQWRPWIVVSQDMQDLVSVKRWVVSHDESEVRRLGVVVNRAQMGNDVIQEKLRLFEQGITQTSDLALEASAAALASGEKGIFEVPWRAITTIDIEDGLDVFRVGYDATPRVPSSVEALCRLVETS